MLKNYFSPSALLSLLIILVSLFFLGTYFSWPEKNQISKTNVTSPSDTSVSPINSDPKESMEENKSHSSIDSWTDFKDKMESGQFRLTKERVDLFLNHHGRTAQNLVAAWHVTQDDSYLKEAAFHFKDDPAVDLNMLAICSHEERLGWLQTLETSAPKNALSHYMGIGVLFEAGDQKAAMAELQTLSTLKDFTDYTQNSRVVIKAMYQETDFEGYQLSSNQAELMTSHPDLDMSLYTSNYIDAANYTRSLSFSDLSLSENYAKNLVKLSDNLCAPSPTASIRNEQAASFVAETAMSLLDP